MPVSSPRYPLSDSLAVRGPLSQWGPLLKADSSKWHFCKRLLNFVKDFLIFFKNYCRYRENFILFIRFPALK